MQGQCEFCGRPAKQVYKKASINFWNIAYECEEGIFTELEKLLNILKDRKFKIKDGEFLIINLKKEEYIKTCDGKNTGSKKDQCQFWEGQGIEEEKIVKDRVGYDGILTNE